MNKQESQREGSGQSGGSNDHEVDLTVASFRPAERDGDADCGSENGHGRFVTGKSAAKPQRAVARLGRGRAVIVIGHDLSIDRFLKVLLETAARARRAKSYGLGLDGFLKMLADAAQE